MHTYAHKHTQIHTHTHTHKCTNNTSKACIHVQTNNTHVIFTSIRSNISYRCKYNTYNIIIIIDNNVFSNAYTCIRITYVGLKYILS